jgi:hypothetical protein
LGPVVRRRSDENGEGVIERQRTETNELNTSTEDPKHKEVGKVKVLGRGYINSCKGIIQFRKLR